MNYKGIIKAGYGWLFQKQIEKGWKPGRLYVVNYHNTPKEHLPNFRKQLEYLSNHFDFVGPNQLKALSTMQAKKPWMLFTFDDGIKSNLNVLPLLDEFGIKAIFFVVYDFIHAKDPHSFYRSNIRFEPHHELEKSEEDMLPMTIDELKELINKGHTIGHHTATHDVRNIKEWSEEKIRFELVESKEKLEQELGTKIKYFASPIDTDFINNKKLSLQQIIENYGLHFTTFSGANISILKTSIVRRINLEIFFNENIIFYKLSKLDCIKYGKK